MLGRFSLFYFSIKIWKKYLKPKPADIDPGAVALTLVIAYKAYKELATINKQQVVNFMFK